MRPYDYVPYRGRPGQSSHGYKRKQYGYMHMHMHMHMYMHM